MKKVCLVLFVCLCCCGCFLFRSRVAPYPTGIIFPIVPSKEIPLEGRVNESLLMEGGRLYTSTQEGTVCAYDGGSRELLWEFGLAAPPRTSLYSGEGCLFIADGQNSLYCLSREGEILWKASLSAEATGGICDDKAQVYLGTEDGLFFALDRSTGDLAWSYQCGGAIHSLPVCAYNRVYFGCDDGNVYCLDAHGALRAQYSASGMIRGGLEMDGERLFFGADDTYVYSLDLPDLKLRWKARCGGKIRLSPVQDTRHVYFISMNNVLTCFYKKNGHVRWWKGLPARTQFRPEIVEDRVIVSTRSRQAVAFETTTGDIKGEYAAKAVLRSNPVWLAPDLVVAARDPITDQDMLQILVKKVGASLASSKPSPQEVNEEIVITASAIGFHLPQYEFYLTRYQLLRYGFEGLIWVRLGEEKLLVQQKSEQNTWNWYPEEEGAYVIEVRIEDEKEAAAGKITFLVEKPATEKIE